MLLKSTNPNIIHSDALVISVSEVTQFAVPVQRPLAGMDRNLAVSDVLAMDQVLGGNTRSKLRCDTGDGLCRIAVPACCGGTVWRAFLHRGAADCGDGHWHCARRQAHGRPSTYARLRAATSNIRPRVPSLSLDSGLRVSLFSSDPS
jgi:hypothetical protein